MRYLLPLVTLLLATKPALATTENCARELAQNIAEDRDDVAAVGFIGLSEAQLLTLVEFGELKGPFEVRLDATREEVRSLTSVPSDRATAERQAEADVWRSELLRLMMARVRHVRTRPRNFVSFLMPLRHLSDKRQEVLTPSIRQISAAVAASTLPNHYAGNAGRLRSLAKIVGVPIASTSEGWMEMERQLTATFADLPVAAGVRVSLYAESLDQTKVRPAGTATMQRLRLPNILMVRPNSVAAQAVIDEFLRKFGFD